MGRSSAILLCWVFVVACSGRSLDDGASEQPSPGQGGGGGRVAQGRSGSGPTRPSESAGMDSGSSPATCQPTYNSGVNIFIPARWVGAEPPQGTFRACRNEECYAAITAGVSLMGPEGLSVDVGFHQGTVGLTWDGHFLAVQGDRYRLEFTPLGDSIEIPVFDTTVTYLVMHPDVPGSCLTGSFANLGLTETIDLTPGATAGAGGEGGEGGTSGAAGS